jgi:DNA-binding LytR/AlgR family response regulator
VKNICPKAKIFLYGTGEELLAETGQPDLLFLDIQMPGMDGMETARRLRQKGKDTILIFVTAVEEYVFQAFDVGAFHYIVKPFCDEKLETVLQKAVDQYCKTIENRQKQGSVPEKKHIMIQSGGTHTKIYLEKIVYAEVFNRKIIIHMTDGEIEYYGKLSELEKLLGEDFFRPHRAYLIHFKYVVKYDASTIYLEQGEVLMAKQNYPNFVKQYLKYNQRKGSV